MENISLSDNQKDKELFSKALIQGAKAKIKHTGQIVVLKNVSDHGISVVSFRTGGEYLISNKFLEPVPTFH